MAENSPFETPGEVRFLYHASHHKCGTHWFRRILSQIAQHYEMPWHNAQPGVSPPSKGIFFDQQSRLDPSCWSQFRGSHMIRDPRDVVISGYFYHLWTNEAWVHEPKPELDGRSYQQHLQSLNKEQGLMAEIDKSQFVFRNMRAWDYRNPAIRELKYEVLFSEPEPHFQSLFEHYGFHDRAGQVALAIAQRSDFRSVSGRTPGLVVEKTVTRSGVPGQWRNEFTPRVTQYFKEATGDLLQVLGYETSNDW